MSRTDYFFVGISVPSNFLCTLIFLQSCACLPVFLSITGFPALSTISCQTSLISASANVIPTNAVANNAITNFFILSPYIAGNAGCTGAGFPPNPVATGAAVLAGDPNPDDGEPNPDDPLVPPNPLADG